MRVHDDGTGPLTLKACEAMFVIIGYVLVIACVFGVYAATGGNMAVVAHAAPHELAVIMGAAIGAFLVANPSKTVKAVISTLPKLFKSSKYTKARYMELMSLLYGVLVKARKEGMMSIESDVEKPSESPLFKKFPLIAADHHLMEFITDYLRMMVSGNLNAHEIESLMDNEIDTHHHEAAVPAARRSRSLSKLRNFSMIMSSGRKIPRRNWRSPSTSTTSASRCRSGATPTSKSRSRTSC